MLSFVPSSAYTISYASSFSTDNLDNKFVKLYSRYLLEYASISVREKNGADIIKNILSRDAEVVLDPTLLLTPEEWNEITPSLEIEEPYILVYLMGYAFDPFPYAYELIAKVRKETGYKKVKIFGHSISKGRNPLYKVIRQAGPLEFIRLFSNASFVITSSFHGTVFALIFSKPFFSLVNDKQSGDDRQLNL